MRLHLFNSAHDDVLAYGRAGYCPPKTVLRMEKDLALLPVWMSDDGDGIVAEKTLENQSFLDSHPLCPPKLELIGCLAQRDGAVPDPWGWDMRARCQFVSLGMGPSSLPRGEDLYRLRQCSSRQTAVSLLSTLRRELPQEYFLGEAAFVYTEDEALSLLSHYGKIVVKRPWSCSGRGVMYLSKEQKDTPQLLSRLLRSGDGLEIDPYYQKVQDFAMEFYLSAQGDIAFRGFSCFFTNERGGYGGNVITDDERVVNLFGLYVAPLSLMTLQRTLEKNLLKKYAGHYVGPLGVDMMICQDGDSFRIHPCVEVNVRHTMGELSLHLRRRVKENAEARFLILSAKTTDQLRESVRRISVESKTFLENAYFRKGYVPLTPIVPGTLFHACLVGV